MKSRGRNYAKPPAGYRRHARANVLIRNVVSDGFGDVGGSGEGDAVQGASLPAK
jgi:hypothetical protein